MCIDLSRLNKYVQRECYQSPTPAEAIADITADDAKYFTIIDAAKGYHQCPLDEESQLYTTFITPFGYLGAPYGLSSIAEHYNRWMAEAFEVLTGFRHIVDDVIIYDKDIESHRDRVQQFLQRCQERQISINSDKWIFCQTRVKFAGFQVSSEGYCIDASITEALANFPTRTNRTDLSERIVLRPGDLGAQTELVSMLSVFLVLPFLQPCVNSEWLSW